MLCADYMSCACLSCPDSVQQLTAALAQAQQANADLQRQYTNDAARAAADVQILQAETEQLRKQNEQQQLLLVSACGAHSLHVDAKLSEQQAVCDQPSDSSKIKAAMLGSLDDAQATAETQRLAEVSLTNSYVACTASPTAFHCCNTPSILDASILLGCSCATQSAACQSGRQSCSMSSSVIFHIVNVLTVLFIYAAHMYLHVLHRNASTCRRSCVLPSGSQPGCLPPGTSWKSSCTTLKPQQLMSSSSLSSNCQLPTRH